MNPGYITISRKFFDCDLWREKRPRSKAEAWLDVIQLAAFAPHAVTTSAGSVRLERGELLASVRFLADRWRWSVGRVQRWIRDASEASRLTIQRETQAGIVYRVVNYELYQGGDTATDTPPDTPNDTATIQRRYKEKKGNKGKKESQKGGGPAGADDPMFCAVYDALPKRTGGHDRKAAYTNYRACVAAGVDPHAMLDGAHRYRAFCDAIGRSGTTYVYDAKNFCRLDRALWTDAWDVPLQVARAAKEPNLSDPTRPDYAGVIGGLPTDEFMRLTAPRSA